MAKEPKRMERVGEPYCIKESDLGRLDARIENTEKTGVEIKESLQRLNENHEKDKQFSNQQFTAITTEIAKISTALQQSTEMNRELLENQNNLLGQLRQLLVDNQNISNNQTNINNEIQTRVTIEDERYRKTKALIENLTARLVELEQHRHTIVSIGALIISLLTAAGLIAQIFQALH